jgi:S-formylglutathione hydrolase FrmB
MYIAYLIVTALAAAANFLPAGCDFVRYKQVSIAMARAGVPDSWMTTLGILKAAGALGLLVGILVPPVGTAAAIALDVPMGALFSFDQDETEPKTLRRRLETILTKATAQQLKQIYGHVRRSWSPSSALVT